MNLVIPSIIISVLFLIVGAVLFSLGIFEPYLDIFISAISMIVYGMWCLFCIRLVAKGKTKFHTTSPIFLGLLIAIILSSIGLNSGIMNLTELGIIIVLLVLNAVLMVKHEHSKNT